MLTCNQQQTPDLPEWNNTMSMPPSSSPEHHRTTKKSTLSSSTNATRPPVPKTRWKTESKPSAKNTKATPIDLSLADDDYGRKSESAAQNGRGTNAGEKSPDVKKRIVGAHIGSPPENTDLLYEYFPLSLDDWYVPFLIGILAFILEQSYRAYYLYIRSLFFKQIN